MDPLGNQQESESFTLSVFFTILLSMFLVIVIGTLGFEYFEEWSFLDSLFMTVITLSTVGYSTIHKLSPQGQVFTIFLIVIGVGTFTYAVAQIVSIMVSGKIREAVVGKRRKKLISKLQNHHIICGYGRVGTEVVKEILNSKGTVLVIDNQIEKWREELELLKVLFISGNATNPGCLEEAGTHRAASIVLCLPSDAENVYTCLSVKSVRPDIFIVSRANSAVGEEHLKKAGANKVIFPYSLSGKRMALLCLRPAVTRFIDTMAGDFKFEEIRIPSNSQLVSKELKDSGIRQASKAIVVGIMKNTGEMVGSPGPSDLIEAEDTLILLGSDDQLEKVEKLVFD